MSKLLVKPAHPRAQFYQEVWDEETGDVVAEHVRAATDPVTSKQVCLPVEVTDTPEVRRALAENIPGLEGAQRKPARMVTCTPAEHEAFYRAKGEAAAAAPAEPEAEAEKADAAAKPAVAGQRKA